MTQTAKEKKPRRICVSEEIFAAFKSTSQVRIDPKLERQYSFLPNEVVLLTRGHREISVVVETDSEQTPIFRL